MKDIIKKFWKEALCFFLLGLILQLTIAWGASRKELARREAAVREQNAALDETIVDGLKVSGWDKRLGAEWDEWWFGSAEENDMFREALLEAVRYLPEGQILSPAGNGMDRDPDFPRSGSAVVQCLVTGPSGKRLSLIWVGAAINEDGSYRVTNNFAVRFLLNRMEEKGIKAITQYYSPRVNNAWSSVVLSPSDLIQGQEEGIFINYEDYDNIPAFFELFAEICLEIKEYQEQVGVDLSQPLRFGEADDETDMMVNKEFYQRRLIDFAALSMNPAILLKLEEQVKAEQLDFFRIMQPARYEAIEKGEYLSRKEYRKKFYLPVFGGYSPWAWPNQWKFGGTRERIEQGGTYETYLRELERSGGRPDRTVSQERPEFGYLSVEEETIASLRGISGQKWNAIYNNYFCFRYPSEYTYGAANPYKKVHYTDVIYYEYGSNHRPFPGYSSDMEILENRKWDRGRVYLLAAQGKAPTETEADSVKEYLEKQENRDRLLEILGGPVDWKEGEYKSGYHEFLVAEGETEQRRAAVYIPKMRETRNFYWILLFEEFLDSEQQNTLYGNRILMADNFIMFPYWYRCRPGDTLEGIAGRLTGDKANVKEICESPVNRIEEPDIIEAGQWILLAPHLFMEE